MNVKEYKASNGSAQIHTFETGLNDYINLDFHEITKVSNGHHVRSGGGLDTFNFHISDSIKHTVVGRIEDFDYSRDKISINGEVIDFNNLQSNVKVVSYNGDHNDDKTENQQWLLVDTGPGEIFYALEGARIDVTGDGGSNAKAHESHFITELPNFDDLLEVKYSDQVNYVPESYIPQGGKIINDTDKELADIIEGIRGTKSGDLIAGGLNDDRIYGRNGNDVIWGGTGSDSIRGGSGDDTIYGNNGRDILHGGQDSDLLYGGNHSDKLFGKNGNDKLNGEQGEDTLFGGNGNDFLKGGAGYDRLRGGAGDDLLIGGKQSDSLKGGSGADTLNGCTGSDKLKGGAGDDLIIGGGGNDRIVGGSGDDILTGGKGSDNFIFSLKINSGGNFERDTITDLELDDRITLNQDKVISGDDILEQFNGVGAAAHSLWYDVVNDDVVLTGDTNGDAMPDFEIHIIGGNELFAENIFM